MGYTEKWRLNARDLEENRNDLDYANSQPNENELKDLFKKNTSDIEKQLQWFNHFVDYVGNVDSNLYNEACEYADKCEDC